MFLTIACVAAELGGGGRHAEALGDVGCTTSAERVVVCSGSYSSGFPGDQVKSGLPTPIDATTLPPSSLYSRAEVLAGPGGGYCVTFVTDVAPDGADVLAPAAEIAAIQLIDLYGLCPGVTPPPAVAQNPEAYAVSFWRTITLPTPKPTVPPGYAITGKPAYLVTDGTVAPAPYSEATPLGLLAVVAHGTYDVVWGDGATGGPFGGEGQPYPHGTIVHTYDDVGTVTVVVTERWSATWSIGTAHGQLDGLQTQASIPGFQVKQVQAVITQNS